MLELLTTALSIDPVTLDLLWTVAVSGLLLAGGALSLALLPWSDAEVASVDKAFHDFWQPVARREPALRG